MVADRFTPTLQDVMYGITKECLLNNIILLAKFFTHADILNLFSCLLFKNDLKYFSDALSKMKNPKAKKKK